MQSRIRVKLNDSGTRLRFRYAFKAADGAQIRIRTKANLKSSQADVGDQGLDSTRLRAKLKVAVFEKNVTAGISHLLDSSQVPGEVKGATSEAVQQFQQATQAATSQFLEGDLLDGDQLIASVVEAFNELTEKVFAAFQPVSDGDSDDGTQLLERTAATAAPPQVDIDSDGDVDFDDIPAFSQAFTNTQTSGSTDSAPLAHATSSQLPYPDADGDGDVDFDDIGAFTSGFPAAVNDAPSSAAPDGSAAARSALPQVDADSDGNIDFDDIGTFSKAVTDTLANSPTSPTPLARATSTQLPNPDVDGDGDVDFDDISAFTNEFPSAANDVTGEGERVELSETVGPQRLARSVLIRLRQKVTQSLTGLVRTFHHGSSGRGLGHSVHQASAILAAQYHLGSHGANKSTSQGNNVDTNA